MNRKTKYHPFLLILAAIFSAALAGCTHMILPPKAPYTAYAPQEKIPLKVALNITDELRKAKSENHFMGDKWVIPVGDSIAQNAGVLSRHMFAQVVDIANGGQPPGEAVDAFLTPKVAYINRTQGATSFGESIVSIKLEWTLSDPTGKAIWVDTVSGQSSGSTGWTDPEKILKKALEDVLMKSQQGIMASEAIRQFASKKSARADAPPR